MWVSFILISLSFNNFCVLLSAFSPFLSMQDHGSSCTFQLVPRRGYLGNHHHMQGLGADHSECRWGDEALQAFRSTIFSMRMAKFSTYFNHLNTIKHPQRCQIFVFPFVYLNVQYCNCLFLYHWFRVRDCEWGLCKIFLPTELSTWKNTVAEPIGVWKKKSCPSSGILFFKQLYDFCSRSSGVAFCNWE